MKNSYYCNKCKRRHFISSAIGKRHQKSSNVQKKVPAKKTIYIENKHPKFRKRLIRHLHSDMYRTGKGRYMFKKNEIPKEIIIHNQNILKKKFGNKVRLYIGVCPGIMCKGSIEKAGNIVHNQYYNLLSWTNDKQTAYEFAYKMGQFGAVISANIPVNKILISYYGSKTIQQSDVRYEYEFIVDLNAINIKEANIIYGKSLIVWKKKYNLT